jgi:hypothetical protein
VLRFLLARAGSPERSDVAVQVGVGGSLIGIFSAAYGVHEPGMAL